MPRRLTVMIRPMSNRFELSSLLGATRNAVLGWGDRIVPKQGTSHEGPLPFSAKFGKVLPHQREESEQFRMEHGWSRVEIDQIVTWLQATADALRDDAANLQANPMEVVNPSDPWGETLVVVGDVDLLRQADNVESLISKWLDVASNPLHPYQPINRELTQKEQAAFAACSCEICGCSPEHGDVVLTGEIDAQDLPRITCNHCGNIGGIGDSVFWEYDHMCDVCDMPADILAEPWTADRTEICEACHKE